MAVLVTGANGFLGKSIVKEFAKKRIVSSLSRTSGDYKINLEKNIPNFNQNFNIVIHAAGKAHSIPKTEIQKNEFYQVNVAGTENLLKGLEKIILPKQFVFISSVSVYGQEKGNNIKETHSLKATDAYGLSKIEAEKLVENWCEKNDIVCTILRLPLVVGENPPGNLGAMFKAIEKGYYFNIGGGKARKSMVLAEDVASFITRVAPIGGIYNLTDGLHPSFNELSFIISENRNKKKPYNLSITTAKIIGTLGDFLGNKAPINSLKVGKIISDLTFDDTKARNILNWDPQSVIHYLKNKKL